MQIHEIRAHVTRVIAAVRRTMYDLDDEIRMCLAALYTGGHVLLEGNPGVGKTELIKALSHVLGLRFGRIQFTPDLMPSDITGTLMLKGGKLEFQDGPIFTSLLLADEINRATPKTQSAMLEAMAEKWVTVLGTRYQLPVPFIVLATQNPIDHEGTYNLPAAQSDRFMFKVRMKVPKAKTLEQIVIKRAGVGAPGTNAPSPAADVDGPVFPEGTDPVAMVAQITATIRGVEPTPGVQQHITNLYLALNGAMTDVKRTAGTAREIEKAASHFQYGISPRAAGDMMLAAKAWVCLTDRGDTVSVSHLKAIVVETLRHRLKPSLDQELDTASTGVDNHEASFERAIERIVALTAPEGFESDHLWRAWR